MVAILSPSVFARGQSFNALPVPTSFVSLQTFAESDISLETLVRCLRQTSDLENRNRILEMIVQRTQTSNERWATYILYVRAIVPVGAQATLADDLYADLCERMLRAVLDPERHYWEENFQQSLIYERKHVYAAFLIREGYCYPPGTKVGERIPRAHLQSVELLRFWEAQCDLYYEDEQAQKFLCSIEASDLCQLVLGLPETLRVVILLVFWEGRTEKEVARVLGVTDRTIRNYLHKALQFLRHTLSGQAGGEL
jgi:RNA polymerase sigma factor (sigma-70 family)